MIHIFMLILVLSLSVGAGVIFLIVEIYRRQTTQLLRFYLGVLIFLGVAIFSDLFAVYIKLVNLQPEQLKDSLYFASVIVYHLMMGGLFYSLPLFASYLVEKPLPNKVRKILAAMVVIYPVSMLAYFITDWVILSDIGDILLLSMILFTVIRLIPKKNEAINPYYRNVGNAFCILLGIFLPLFVVDVFIDIPIRNANHFIYDISVFLLLFYIVWNVANAVYIVPQFNLAFPQRNAVCSDQKMDLYQLSKREKEIAALICNGLSNKEIASRLQISTMTVKNHIYNIFKKTGAVNRVELLNLLNL
jgi:DNA-binding CsgD family transcriptional regulator